MPQFCCGGLNFGYFYDRSPIIAHDGETPPPYSMYDFTPSIVPGCRVPHVWLRNGRSLYDAMGPAYTLLRFDRSCRRSLGWCGGRARHAVDCSRRRTGRSDARLSHKLVLSRPDQHVAWRGNAQPDDPMALIDMVRGALSGARPPAPPCA